MILLKKVITLILSFIFLFLSGIYIFANDNDCTEINVNLGTGRYWDAFDGNLPVINDSIHWYLGVSRLDQSDTEGKIPPGGKFVEGNFKISGKGDVTEVMNFSKFGPAEDKEIFKASGVFYEIPIYFFNSCNKNIMVVLSKKDNKALDVQLELENNKILSPVGFRIPGFNAIDEKSLFTSFEGKLSIALPSRTETWLLLVFDVPKNIKNGQLRICSSVVIDVEFPVQNSISPNNIFLLERKRWKINCNAVQTYSTKLNFQMKKSWKEGEDSSKAIVIYSTNRKALLDILNSFQLEDEKDLQKRLLNLIQMVKKAPEYNAVYPESDWIDVTLSRNLFTMLGNFMDDVSTQAAKYNIRCEE